MNQINFSQIFKQLKQTGGKYIIIEDGKPVYVIMSWEDFQRQTLKNTLNTKETAKLSEKELINKINEEIALWKETQDQKRILDEFSMAPDIPYDVDFDYLRTKNLSTDVDIEEIPF